MSGRILIVDGNHELASMLGEALEGTGHSVKTTDSVEEALAKASNDQFDLVIADVMLPGLGGVEAVPRLKEAAGGAEVIAMTGDMTGSSASGLAVAAAQNGAYDVFSRPFCLADLEVVARRALEKVRLDAEAARILGRIEMEAPIPGLVGRSEPMKRAAALIRRVAKIDATVLITGESGTGKEVVADCIHSMSRRASGPFVKINCAAIPENLLESELFGHERGAFTGATSTRKGKFEMAHGGTLLLDEIGDMSLSVQPKILRAVEQRQIERVGGDRSIPTDARIIAATNQDLAALLQEGAFREDLYYRLNVAAIHLPPLRQRKEDIPLLTSHFLDRINDKLGTSVKGLSTDAMGVAMSCDWPGNVRQLANVLERAVIMSDQAILTGHDLQAALQQRYIQATSRRPAGAVVPLRVALEEMERAMIIQALRQMDGVQKEAATALGISPTNLWNKIQKHRIDPGQYSQAS